MKLDEAYSGPDFALLVNIAYGVAHEAPTHSGSWVAQALTQVKGDFAMRVGRALVNGDAEPAEDVGADVAMVRRMAGVGDARR